MTEKKSIDMLNGPLGPKMIRFAIPLALTGVLQQLFNAADVAVVGQFVGKEAMAAVGSNSPIIGLMVNLFVGVSLGANVVISTATGSRDRKTIRQAVHTAVLVAIIGGFLMMGIGQLIAHPLLNLLGVPGNILPMALAYLRIYMIGLPVIFLYNFESAIFRSQGDTKTPLICLFLSGIINVALNLFFVLVVGMTADGVALATVIANIVSSGLMFIILFRSDADISVRWQEFRISGGVLRRMLYIGVPAGLQGMVFSVSNLVMQSAINSLGSDVMAASSASFNIEIFAYYFLNAFGQAATTFTGQNRGAGKMDRCRKIVRTGLVQDILVSLMMSVIILPLGHNLTALFNSDPAVIKFAVDRLWAVVTFEWINSIMEILSGALRGHGLSLGPAIMTLIGVCGTRIVWVALIFPLRRTFFFLMTVYPISWVITAVSLIIYYSRKKPEIYGE